MSSCFECGQPASHHHHVVPRSLGGTKTIPLCDCCHPKAHGENGHWKTSELIRAAMKVRKAKGLRVGGRHPYGYDWKDGTLVENPAEQEVIRLIWELRKTGIGPRLIVKELDARGIKSRFGKLFNYSSVEKILGLYGHGPHLSQKHHRPW